MTGSSSGIGAGIAAVLAAEGATVIVHGRDEARTRAVAKRLDAIATTHVVLGDLSKPVGCDSVVEAVNEKAGAVRRAGQGDCVMVLKERATR